MIQIEGEAPANLHFLCVRTHQLRPGIDRTIAGGQNRICKSFVAIRLLTGFRHAGPQAKLPLLPCVSILPRPVVFVLPRPAAFVSLLALALAVATALPRTPHPGISGTRESHRAKDLTATVARLGSVNAMLISQQILQCG
jgi:hypothetical protein